MRLSRTIRTAAWAVLAAGVAAPLVRRRAKLPPPVVLGLSFAAPFAVCVVTRRTPARDVATVCLQMWAYVNSYAMPNDDPEALERRVRIDYPVKVDRFLGLGTPFNLRLQRALAHPTVFSPFDKILVWAHWMWFAVPHGTVAYVLLRHRDQFPRAALQIYAVFDLGSIVYWLVPTAPPWYAAERGRLEDGTTPQLRRMMVEYGEHFWRRGWGPLYSALGGNPLAAMPSLHFATSVMAAHVLTDVGVVPGTIGWTYALILGLALVYLGEHYVVDLLAGLTLTEAVRVLGPRTAPLLRRVSRAVQALEARATA